MNAAQVCSNRRYTWHHSQEECQAAADAGYPYGFSDERFANQVKDICGAQVEVVKRSELHKFVVLPRRWVVERLFGWLDKFRRLWKNCERKLFISALILYFPLIAILIRRL